ncbi:large conductance mechanosensitive channel protein [[Synechococcus] sp. NIES-970]|uniref:large conductance mechanosensitive channel protein MscL n=1 Tax=Picosynechococcus sp. NKBG15041c TaxID=1407650 RepID=UPI00041EF13A|nr:large conductance mechanosensitive channel protein MscL [Picosynechococcus sp. NKBG15041c]BAW95343.1 large conductance mechanosensitive channel protein [[Synechococcus] sp. NIES-970]
MAKKSSFWSDFQAFIMRGNVIDLAVAVIIGGAFGQIINSLVADIITPVLLQPALNAANLDALSELSFNGIKYGVFLAAVINFLVIAFAIFLLIRALEKVQRRLSRAKAMEELDTPAPEPDAAVVAQEKLTAALERLADLMENRPQ